MTQEISIVDSIAFTFGLGETELSVFLRTAPYRYKIYYIKKRSGTGYREIAQPAKGLKTMQRFVIKEFCEDSFPIHDAAMAYTKGVSIRDNALAHSGSNYILKMDFENFFHSLVDTDLQKHTERHCSNMPSDFEFVFANLFFRKNKVSKRRFVSMGAPSSPFLSNSLMYEFDVEVSELAKKHDVVYTRYADDLTFSSIAPDVLFGFPAEIQKILARIEYPVVKINEAKTVFASKKNNRHVTGLVITNEGSVSIGRKKKRYVKSLCFSFINSKLGDDGVEKLNGLLAYINDVEPTFLDALSLKYGEDIIAKVKSAQAKLYR